MILRSLLIIATPYDFEHQSIQVGSVMLLTTRTSSYLSAQYGRKRALIGGKFSKVSSIPNSPAKKTLSKGLFRFHMVVALLLGREASADMYRILKSQLDTTFTI